MSLIASERKYLEILRILKEHQEPMGAKRLSEMMAERGFVLHDTQGEWQSTLRINDKLSLTTSKDILEAMGEGTGPRAGTSTSGPPPAPWAM